MHQELAKSGLQVMSLSIDDESDREAALAFLKKQKAEFPNFFLKDKLKETDEGDKKLLHSTPPVVHVFDRTGKLAKSLSTKEELDSLPTVVKELLEKK